MTVPVNCVYMNPQRGTNRAIVDPSSFRRVDMSGMAVHGGLGSA